MVISIWFNFIIVLYCSFHRTFQIFVQSSIYFTIFLIRILKKIRIAFYRLFEKHPIDYSWILVTWFPGHYVFFFFFYKTQKIINISSCVFKKYKNYYCSFVYMLILDRSSGIEVTEFHEIITNYTYNFKYLSLCW